MYNKNVDRLKEILSKLRNVVTDRDEDSCMLFDAIQDIRLLVRDMENQAAIAEARDNV